MAILSDLVSAVAAAEGIDEERVASIARAIREHGLIRTSGRGASAARMDEQDAANLLIAVNVADIARTAADAVAQFRALQAKRGREKREFGIELEELIASAKRQSLPAYFMNLINVVGPRNHVIGRKVFSNDSYRFSVEFEKPVASVLVSVRTSGHTESAYVQFSAHAPNAAEYDRRERTMITQKTIFAVARALRADRQVAAADDPEARSTP